MEYLADTVAIVRHLRGHPALGPQAAQILRDADAGRHHAHLIVTVNAGVVLAAAEVDDVPELHDRIIVGTAKWLGVPILTGDEFISESRHAQTIW